MRMHQLLGIICAIAALQLSDRAHCDVINLDDFSTGMKFRNQDGSNTPGVFKNSAGQVIAQNSTNYYSVWGDGGFISVGKGNSAEWRDTGAGILGGNRDVIVKNANPSGTSGVNSSVTMRGPVTGNMNVNSPASNVVCLTCLGYSFPAIDVALHHVFLINFVALDASARGNLAARLSFSDGTTTAVLNMSTTDATIGINKFDLAGATNWGLLNKNAVTSAMLEFTATANGVDFVVDSIGFSTNPEPGTFFAIAAGVLIFAVKRLTGKRLKGIEPSPGAWEATVLPLHHSRVAHPSDNTL